MLAKVVFVAFNVFVEEGSVRVDGECRHFEREDLLRGGKTLAGFRCLDGLGERKAVKFAVAGEGAALRVFLDIGGEVESAVGRYRERVLPASEGSETKRSAAL